MLSFDCDKFFICKRCHQKKLVLENQLCLLNILDKKDIEGSNLLHLKGNIYEYKTISLCCLGCLGAEIVTKSLEVVCKVYILSAFCVAKLIPMLVVCNMCFILTVSYYILL